MTKHNFNDNDVTPTTGKCVVYHAVLPVTGNSKYVMSVASNEVTFINTGHVIQKVRRNA